MNSAIAQHIAHLEARGWTTTEAGLFPDSLIEVKGWLAIRGLMVDGVFLNTRENRIALKLEKKQSSKKDRND